MTLPLLEELDRRQTNRDAVADYFKANPSLWIDAAILMTLAGAYAWRTRVSEARRQLKMTIENKVERDFNNDGTLNVRSYYRYLPYVPLGPSADTPRESTLFNVNDARR